MQLKFEHFAATSLMGTKESPPRRNGELLFGRHWEEGAFGIAIALSKKGLYEWEEFRQQLIAAIAEWETTHCSDDPDWDYYQRWLLALERIVLESKIVDSAELEARTAELLAATTSASS